MILYGFSQMIGKRGKMSYGTKSLEAPVTIYDSSGSIIGYIDENGFERIEYRDEYTGDDWHTPQGAGSTPSLTNVTIGGVLYRTRQFANNATNQMSNVFEMAHDVDFYSLNNSIVNLEFHVHCSPSDNSAGNVRFYLEYAYKPVNKAPISQTVQYLNVQIAVNQELHHKVAGVELPIPAGGFGIGDMIYFNLKRVPSDSEDTYSAPIIFDKAALHVPTNSRGSRQRYVK